MKRTISPGFTLIEVILAVGLTAMLAGGVLSFVWNLLDRREALLEHGRDSRGAALLIDAVERDLSGAVVTAGDEAGVKGTGATLRVLTRGVWIGDTESGEGAPDLQGAEYRHDAGLGGVTGRRWSGAAGGAGGGGEVICERVERLRLRYLRGSQWVESFDSAAAGGLPAAVEVAIWFGEPRREEEELAEGEREAMRGVREPDLREPDRVRVIAVPDGADAGWGGGG